MVYDHTIWWLAVLVCFVFVVITMWLARKAHAIELVEKRINPVNEVQAIAVSTLLKEQKSDSWFNNVWITWQRDLLNAGFIAPKAWQYFGYTKLASAILAGTLLWLSMKDASFLMILACGFLANLLPDMWLSQQKKAQRQQILTALPNHLSLMVVCLRAGYSIDRAIKMVSDELMSVSPALSVQWKITLEQLAITPDRWRVWDALDARISIEVFSDLVELLQQSERFGSAIADTLTTFHQQIRESEQLVLEEKIGQVASRITLPMLLLIFLPLMVIMLAPQLSMLMAALKSMQ